MNYKHCPKCRGDVGFKHLKPNSLHPDDNISEVFCTVCSWRVGVWCHSELKDNEYEPKHCKGGIHPVYVSLDEEKS